MAKDHRRRSEGMRRLADHNLVVVELAAMAEMAGCSVEFEPPHGQGRLADLLVSEAALPAPIAVEVTRFGFTRDTREASELTAPLSQRLLTVDGAPDLHVSFHLVEAPTLEEFEPWVQQVEDALRLETQATVVGPRGCVATIGPQTDDHPGAWGLRGPASVGDEWERMAVRIREKAKQCSGGLPTWLHFTHDGFLFALNSWAAADHQVRLAQLAGNALPLLDGVPELRGLVLTTTIGAYNPPGTTRIRSSVRHMEPSTAREVYIVPSTETDLAEVEWWLDLYDEQEPKLQRC